MLSEEVQAFLKKNKSLVVLGAIALIVVLAIFSVLFSGLRSMGISDSYESGIASDVMRESAVSKSAGGFGLNYQSNAQPASPSSGSYVEVKEGSMRIETKNADSDSSSIRSLAESLGGYIEDTRKYDNVYSTNINLRARVPEANFQGFVDSLKDQYDEKDFTVSFYRVSTQREIDELTIINTAFSNYAELRNRTMKITLDENQINLLFRITEKELDLKRLEKQYTSSLTGKQQRSEYATITITLEEKKKVTIMPENLGNQLRMKTKNALSNTANSIIDIFTGSIAIFVSAVKYVIYLILLVIPFIVGVRVLTKIYYWILSKI